MICFVDGQNCDPGLLSCEKATLATDFQASDMTLTNNLQNTPLSLQTPGVSLQTQLCSLHLLICFVAGQNCDQGLFEEYEEEDAMNEFYADATVAVVAAHAQMPHSMQ